MVDNKSKTGTDISEIDSSLLQPTEGFLSVLDRLEGVSREENSFTRPFEVRADGKVYLKHNGE